MAACCGRQVKGKHFKFPQPHKSCNTKRSEKNLRKVATARLLCHEDMASILIHGFADGFAVAFRLSWHYHPNLDFDPFAAATTCPSPSTVSDIRGVQTSTGSVGACVTSFVTVYQSILFKRIET